MKHAPGFLALVDAAKAAIKEITIEQYLQEDKEGVLIDVREDREWIAGHLPGAVHLGKGVIERDVEALYPDKTTRLVLYCGGGFRSALAADNLQKMGYTQVVSLAGGVSGWRQAGHSLVADEQTKVL